jgi:hypothetical protein
MKTEQIQELIKQQKLIPLSPIKEGVWKCQDNRGKYFVFKLVHNESEIRIYQLVLTPLAKENIRFNRLLLPELVNTDGQSWIIIPFYSGISYHNKWDESEAGKIGGSALGKDLATEMAEVIMDLRKIDVTAVEENQTIKELPNSKFDFSSWLQIFKRNSAIFETKGLVSKNEIEKAKSILGEGLNNSAMIFSNGDYYPRNIIKTPDNKIVLIDWQGWGDNWRVNFVDHIENLIAFGYIHMWNNYLWQWTYLKEIQKKMKIDPHNFQKALIIKSFDQACLWKPLSDKPEENLELIPLFRYQMQIFSNALNFEFVQKLLKFTRPKFNWRFFK